MYPTTCEEEVDCRLNKPMMDRDNADVDCNGNRRTHLKQQNAEKPSPHGHRVFAFCECGKRFVLNNLACCIDAGYTLLPINAAKMRVVVLSVLLMVSCIKVVNAAPQCQGCRGGMTTVVYRCKFILAFTWTVRVTIACYLRQAPALKTRE